MSKVAENSFRTRVNILFTYKLDVRTLNKLKLRT